MHVCLIHLLKEFGISWNSSWACSPWVAVGASNCTIFVRLLITRVFASRNIV